MGIARDVFEIIDTNFSELSDGVMKRFDDYDTHAASISRRAADGTLQFPLIISRAITFENAQRVTRAAEQKAASFAQIVMTMNPNMDTMKDKGGSDYVRQFHSNIDTQDDTFGQAMHFINTDASKEGFMLIYTTDKPGDYRILKEQLRAFGADWREDKINDVSEAKYVKDNTFVIPYSGSELKRILREKYRAIRETPDESYWWDEKNNRVIKHRWDPETGLHGGKDFEPGAGVTNWKPIDFDEYYEKVEQGADEADWRDDGIRSQFRQVGGGDISEDNVDDPDDETNGGYNTERNDDHRSSRRSRDYHRNSGNSDINIGGSTINNTFNHKHSHTIKTGDTNVNPNIKINVDAGGSKKEITGVDVVYRDLLKDNDVKKANELVPTLLHIRVIATKERKYVDFVIGVKATMHPVTSEEMIENLVEACRFHSEVFRFIRWTTGEISFFGDFLLNMKDSKKAVAKQESGGSPWWNRLHKMSVIAKFKKTAFMKRRILPNASIVVTQNEVDYIKNTYGFDLMKPNFIEDIMEKFFLLCFIIVDESLEVVHFKYDGQNSYETVSFSGLEKQNADSARQFRDILKAVQRV